ncbi:MAG: hypothetical protein K0R67_579 [Paenibacillus sp.]|nr:hypothetical protein [Paenibacillus sp.]
MEEKPPDRLEVLGALDLAFGVEPSLLRTDELLDDEDDELLLDDEEDDDVDGLVVKEPVLPPLEGVVEVPELLLDASVLLLVLPLELKLPVRSEVDGFETSESFVAVLVELLPAVLVP